MKFLVTSDSHGLTDVLEHLVQRHKDDVQCFFHCGDSELPSSDPVMAPFQAVKGNCDWGPGSYSNQLVSDIGAVNLLVTHGHLYNVKMTEMNLIYKAEESGASIVCFGHTHVAGSEVYNGIVLINPGSLRLPRGRTQKSYAVCDWDAVNRVLKVTFYEDNGVPIPDLAAEYHL